MGKISLDSLGGCLEDEKKCAGPWANMQDLEGMCGTWGV